LPIDQIISHIANTSLEKQQVTHIADNQAGAENTSAEASRRSSTSTQNTDTLTPTNIPSDPTDNQETVVSATSAETVMETYNIQDDANNSAFKSYQNSMSAQTQIQDITVNASCMNESRKESQEQQDAVDIKESGTIKETSDVAVEISNLIVPAPVRKISRFLVSPVVEQKNITIEDEAVNEGIDRTNVAASQIVSQSVVPTTNVESTLKIEDHAEANIPGIHNMTMHEQANNNEMIQGIHYTMDQADNTQQILQQGQQPIGLQQNIIQVQTLQQVTGHMQQTATIGQSKQHTIIVQGGAMTTQQTAQQMPQTGVQHFMPVSSQKELSTQQLHVNGITQTQMPMQYPNQTVVQSSVVMQQPQQQISMQTNMMQPHVQEHQLQSQMQAPAIQQFVPQQIQPPTQQYVMMSGQPIIQPVQPMSIDDRNRRIASLSAASNVSMDSGISDSSNIPEEKRQNVSVTNVPVVHMQHAQIVPPDMSNAMPLTQSIVESGQQLQTVHQNIQHVSGTMQQSIPLPVHSIATTDISAPKMTIKTKEVSSTLPDLAQNLANILSNPKSKSVTPHPLTTHESIAIPNVATGTLVDYKSVQSEQYFQPIQPEASQLQIQPPIQHNYQGQIVHQTYSNQQNFQQAFQNQQLLHQNQAQPISQSVQLTIPQQIDVQSQIVPATFQNVSGQSIVQGKWIVSANQTLLQQPLRQQNQPPQLLQNQTQLQQISMPLQMQQQTISDQQYNESSVVLDQSHLHLKLPEQHPMKLMETENLEFSNSNE